MRTMRVLIELTSPTRLNFSCAAAGRDWLHVRDLTLSADETFPLPPANETSFVGQPHADLCRGEKLAESFEILALRSPTLPSPTQPGTIELVGRYLFTTLLGHALWQEIVDLALEAKDATVELAFVHNAEHRWLHGLPWEMMCGDTQGAAAKFLVAGRKPSVIFTRLVPVDEQNYGKLEQADYPPRVLFVLGQKLGDESIRPGAEIIGLLRRLRSAGRSIHRRILQEANLDSLKNAVKSFRPHVVHFICHGQEDGGKGYLTLMRDADDGAPGPDREQFKLCHADNILDALRAAKLPIVIVLSACYSATGRLEMGHMPPLAAELVEKGVPIVLGMSGRVADRACRLFTRRFGESLVSGDSLARAAIEARLTAHSRGADPAASVDWAFPTIFMASQVQADFALVPAAPAVPAVPPVITVDDRIRSLGLDREPVFCAREEFFNAYYAMLEDRSAGAFLGIYTKNDANKLGKTRLIQELAAQAVRDGHLPVSHFGFGNNWTPGISSSADLALRLVLEVGKTRHVFNLDPAFDSLLLQSLLKKNPHVPNGKQWLDGPRTDQLYLELLDTLQEEANLKGAGSKQLRSDIVADLLALRAEARAKIKPDAQVVVFLDKIHLYGNMVDERVGRDSSMPGASANRVTRCRSWRRSPRCPPRAVCWKLSTRRPPGSAGLNSGRFEATAKICWLMPRSFCIRHRDRKSPTLSPMTVP
jgi:hypothetical protein